jgi:hypothetical protein
MSETLKRMYTGFRLCGPEVIPVATTYPKIIRTQVVEIRIDEVHCDGHFQKGSIIISLTSPSTTVATCRFPTISNCTTNSRNRRRQLLPNLYLGLDLFILRRLELCTALRFVLEFLDCFELSKVAKSTKIKSQQQRPKTHLLR